METVVGIFPTRAAADAGVQRLRALSIPDSNINVLAPDSTIGDLERVPTTDTEQPGMGAAVGAVVGTAVGASTGALVPLVIPGIGPVIAVGMAAMGILGALGAVGGAAVGDKIEDSFANGLPKDELFFYEDALRRGNAVVIALVDDDKDADAARHALADAGARDLDAARHEWWIGIRDAEQAAYDVEHGNFARDEAPYRHGFEAALHPEIRGRTYREVEPELRTRHGKLCDDDAFRRGFERGCAYRSTGTSRRNVEAERPHDADHA